MVKGSHRECELCNTAHSNDQYPKTADMLYTQSSRKAIELQHFKEEAQGEKVVLKKGDYSHRHCEPGYASGKKPVSEDIRHAVLTRGQQSSNRAGALQGRSTWRKGCFEKRRPTATATASQATQVEKTPCPKTAGSAEPTAEQQEECIRPLSRGRRPRSFARDQLQWTGENATKREGKKVKRKRAEFGFRWCMGPC